MIEFLQDFIRFIWQLFLPVSMPWQAAIMLFLFVLFVPLLVLRVIPWIISAIFEFLFVLIWFVFERLLWLDYHLLTKKRRNLRNKPLAFSFFLGNLLQEILSNFRTIVIKIKSLKKKAFQLKVFLKRKRFSLYFLPFIVPILMWFITPVLGADSQFSAFTYNGAEFWCSLENWAMSGKLNTPYFGCYYPGKKAPLISNYRKIKEYKLINQIQKYNRAILGNSDNTEMYLKRGNIYLEKGNINLALQDFNKTLNLNLDYAPGYRGRGDVYLAKNDLNAAYKQYSIAIDKDPNYAPGYRGRGDVYLAKNDLNAAYKQYSIAIGKDPNYAPGYKGRGNIYLAKSNDKYAALKEYRKAIRIDSGYADAYSQLGSLYVNNFNKQNLAIKNYRIAANLFRKYGQINDYESIIELITQIEYK